MMNIRIAKEADLELLIKIGRQTFIESHGHSAAPADIDAYVSKSFSSQQLHSELLNPENIFHLLMVNNEPAGYSKVVFNKPNIAITEKNIAKLERVYLLKSFYGMKAGELLLAHILDLTIAEKQAGTWLNVWTENRRAIAFYEKHGFRIIGQTSFNISANHSNPNHIMYKQFIATNDAS